MSKPESILSYATPTLLSWRLTWVGTYGQRHFCCEDLPGSACIGQ